MDFLKRLFGSRNEKYTCPRCLGKGHVDEKDITRLNMELFWEPGPCAFCNEIGLVDAETKSNVPADQSYLTIDLPLEEREKLLNGDPEAIERGKFFEEEQENFIKQILYLYQTGNLTPEQITEFFLLRDEHVFMQAGIYTEQEQILLDFVRKAIKQRG